MLLACYDWTQVICDSGYASRESLMAGWFRKRRANDSMPAKYDDPIEQVAPNVLADRAAQRLARAEKTLLRKPGNVQAWNEKAWALLDLRRYDESISAAEQAIALDPKQASAWNNKGAALSGLKRDEEALACYEQALNLYPKYPLAWKNKAKILLRLERLEEALEAGGIAAQFNPQNANPWWVQARALR
ncbi:MAG TPA: tetratricopeptide repeat protein, partial [Ktedonobacterales bacterium]|nr:tetratricopeptide repeat protein [Ktedonobacterales bacterium]